MKKAQMKIQEMAFVLLALVLLAVIGLIFMLKISGQKITESAEDIKAQTTVSLLEKIANIPEINCFCKPSCRINCIDADKVSILQSMPSSQKELIFQGVSNATIVRVYPEGNDLSIYSGEPSNAPVYSTFINLCQYDLSGEHEYRCAMALLVLQGEEAKK